MKFLLASALLAATVVAQDPAVNTTALAELANAFQQAGLTSLSTIAQQAGGSPEGQRLLALLTDGQGNKTIFAPSNEALMAQPETEPSITLKALAYHLVQGPFLNESAFFTAPNDTILRTYLNDTSLVRLEGNASQVLVANVKDGKVTIKNQEEPVTVLKFTNTSNFNILTIDGVLTPPGEIESVLKGAGLTSFVTALETGGILDEVKNASGITLFAPTNDAISNALASIGDQATNTTLLSILLGNHIINGTSVYSTLFNKDYTSGSGQAIKFTVGQNTTMIRSGDGDNFNATVTRLDILARNGVIHVLDGVLANTANNSQAADDAFSSASSAAASPTSSNGPVGSAPPNSPGAGAISLHIPFTALAMAVASVVFGSLIL